MDLLNFCLLAVSSCGFVYTLQLMYFNKHRLRGGTVADQTSKRKARLLRIGPAVCVIVATVATVVVSIRAGSSDTCSEDENAINPDIGGIGVLLSLFSPCLVLVVVLSLGHFTAENMGTKELCMAQCANLLYLAVNLAKGMSRLNVRELTIAMSSMDAVSASVSMAFSSKDVLAARKLVTIGSSIQVAAFGIEGAGLQRLQHLVNTPCISAMPNQLFREGPSAWAWVYFGLRITVTLLPALVVRRLASDLNKVENRSTGSRSMRVKARKLWRFLPTTVSTNYLLFSSYVCLHWVSVFAVVRKTNTIGQSWTTLKSEWGQSGNAIVTAYAVGHVAYTAARLFSADSMRDRANDAETIGLSSSWPFPGQHLMKFWPLNRLRQRWPFVLRLDFPDHLIVAGSTLQKVLNPLPEQDPIVREKLWEELMDGFTWNDHEGILDCLIQGAPVDRPNEAGDYPIHLASRTNDTKILMWTLPKEQDHSKRTERLLLKNTASETPLEIACNANRLEAVQYIMERLPQENDEAEAAVCRAFKSSIITENLDVLKKLRHLWPAWQALRISTTSAEYGPLYYAVAMHKERAADVLLDPKIDPREDPKVRRAYELARTAALPDVVGNILQGKQGVASTKTKKDLVYGVLGCQLEDEEVLELLQALEIDVQKILFGTVAAARSAIDISVPLRRPELWRNLVTEANRLDPFMLDSLVLLLVALSADLSRREQGQDIYYPALAALIQNGARDWSKAMEASALQRFDDLEDLISAESDSASLRRMVNVRDRRGDTILAHALSQRCCSALPRNTSRKADDSDMRQEHLYVRHLSVSDPEKLFAMLDILLKHGSPFNSSDINNTYEHHCKRREGEDRLLIRMVFLAEKKEGVASGALPRACRRIYEDGTDCVKNVHMLLRSGADPTLKDEHGRTPRENLEGNHIRRPDHLGERAPDGRSVRMARTKIVKLLQRWENFHRDPSTGNPSDQPDQDWVQVYNEVVRTTNQDRWATLVAKNPDFKVVWEDSNSAELRRSKTAVNDGMEQPLQSLKPACSASHSSASSPVPNLRLRTIIHQETPYTSRRRAELRN